VVDKFNPSVMTFLNKDFLLHTETAIKLYEQYASGCAIADYHNHLSPKDIAENRQFKNLTEIWLEGDHYKWRAMRINGVNEKYCTGDASPEEKFKAWAATVPYSVRNPLYHWTHLELKRYFGITDLLNEKSAEKIYERASMMLKKQDFRVQGLLQKMNVKVVCTTDDPIDSLDYHQQFAKVEAGFKMFPTFRPDKSYATHDAVFYNRYVDSLGNVAHVAINTLDDLFNALSTRMDFFDSLGCRAADHGLEHLYFDDQAQKSAPELFKKIRSDSELTWTEQNQLRCAILLQLSKWYYKKGWVQQFHLGAMRNNNSRIMKVLGPDTGFDSIGDFPQARHMSSFFNELDKSNELTKTIIYNLNPADNEVFATMLGNFSDGSVPGKMQWGSGWWFLDQKDGMEKQMNTLSNMGLLSRFVGMVTDSRSFLSFPRHEYFRRVLCNLIGNDVERGELPNDIDHLGKIVKDICFNNTMKYFGF
jgi:glucuronate isomerase